MLKLIRVWVRPVHFIYAFHYQCCQFPQNRDAEMKKRLKQSNVFD